MKDFHDSTLWRISAYERMREATGTSGFARLGSNTTLSTTLQADLQRVESSLRAGLDLLEVVAACQRNRESALLLLEHDRLVWPITVFPAQSLFHCPRDFVAAAAKGLPGLRLLAVEPPGVRPPGHWQLDRIGDLSHYRPMQPLLWRLALFGPRGRLLTEISGQAAYRATRRDDEPLEAPGAVGPVVQRLYRESATLADISRWPGMDSERAARTLNGMYLNASLMVLRTHPAARSIRMPWQRGR